MRPNSQDISDFKTKLRGPLIQPDDGDYDATRVVWNGMIDRRPSLIARCHSVADVIAAVSFARAHGMRVAVRGGGHNVAGYAVCDEGLMIDLSLMRAVRVDPQARRAWVQGGATWGDVDHETTAFGLATPGGVVSTTGVGGLTLSGGIGWLRQTHGLCVDNVVSVDIVTADGQLLHADGTSHPDLFWAVRGGGGNSASSRHSNSVCIRLHRKSCSARRSIRRPMRVPSSRRGGTSWQPLQNGFVAWSSSRRFPTLMTFHRKPMARAYSRWRQFTTARRTRARRQSGHCVSWASRYWISVARCRIAQSKAFTTECSRKGAIAATSNRSTCLV